MDVCYLYKVYFKPFYQHIKTKATPLHFAAIYGEFEICQPFRIYLTLSIKMNEFVKSLLANETDELKRLGVLAARVFILRQRIHSLGTEGQIVNATDLLDGTYVSDVAPIAAEAPYLIHSMSLKPFVSLSHLLFATEFLYLTHNPLKIIIIVKERKNRSLLWRGKKVELILHSESILINVRIPFTLQQL